MTSDPGGRSQFGPLRSRRSVAVLLPVARKFSFCLRLLSESVSGMNFTRSSTDSMTSFQATLVNVGYGQLALRDAQGKIAQKWMLSQPKCVIGANANCSVRCLLPGIADHHVLLVIGGKQLFMRALTPGVQRDGKPLNELFLSGENIEFTFDVAGHHFEYARKANFTQPAAPSGTVSASYAKPLMAEAARVVPGRLNFTFVRALEKNRQRQDALRTNDSSADKKVNAQRPAWVEEIVRDALRPVEVQLENIFEPIQNLERQLRRQRARLRRQKKALEFSRHGAQPIPDSHTQNLIESQETIQKIVRDQTARLETVNERVSDIVSQLATLERIVSAETGQHSEEIHRTTQSGEEIMRLQREMLDLINALQARVAQPPALSGDDQLWRTAVQRQLDELHESLSALEDIKNTLQTAVVQNRELTQDFQSRWQALEESVRRPIVVSTPTVVPTPVAETIPVPAPTLITPAATVTPSNVAQSSVSPTGLAPAAKSIADVACAPTVESALLPLEPMVQESDAAEPIAFTDQAHRTALPVPPAPSTAEALPGWWLEDPIPGQNSAAHSGTVDSNPPRAVSITSDYQVTVEADNQTSAELTSNKLASDELASNEVHNAAGQNEFSSSAAISDDSLQGYTDGEQAESYDGLGSQELAYADDGVYQADPQAAAQAHGFLDEQRSAADQLYFDDRAAAVDGSQYAIQEWEQESGSDRFQAGDAAQVPGDITDFESSTGFDSYSPAAGDESGAFEAAPDDERYYDQTADAGAELSWSSEEQPSAQDRAADDERDYFRSSADDAVVAQTQDSAGEYHSSSSQQSYNWTDAQPEAELSESGIADAQDLEQADYAVSAFSQDQLAIEQPQLYSDEVDNADGDDRYQARSDYDPSASDRQDSYAPPAQSAVSATPASSSSSSSGPTDASASEEPVDESVEDYMRRLLARMRGVSESEVSLPGLDEKPAPQPAPAPAARPEAPKSAVEALIANESTATVSNLESLSDAWTDPFNGQKHAPRPPRAEINEDINAMRELANTSARSAIQMSARRRHGTAVLIKSSVAMVGLCAGLALISINGVRVNIALIATIASFLVTAIWGYDALATLRPLLQATQDAKSAPKADEISADGESV